MARTAPVPNFPAIPGMNPGLFVMGGGGDGGGPGAGGGKGKGKGQGADGKNGGNDAKGGGKGACGQGAGSDGGACPNNHGGAGGAQGGVSQGDPVDVVTGEVFVPPVSDVLLPGPLALNVSRSYRSGACERDVGLGHGWTHTLSWRIEQHRRTIVVYTFDGVEATFASVREDTAILGPHGWLLHRDGARLVLEIPDGRSHIFEEDTTEPGGSSFRLVEVHDRSGNRVALAYEGAQLVRVIDSVGRVVHVRRTAMGRIASWEITLRSGEPFVFARFRYDDRGDLIEALDPEGHATRFAYDDEHRMIEKHHPTGLRFHYRYDVAGRCVETWGDYGDAVDPCLAPDVSRFLADGRTPAKGIHHVVLEYGPDRYTEAMDATTIHRSSGNVFGKVDTAVCAGSVYTRRYDARGHMIEFVDPTGATTRWERDFYGNETKVVDPLGHTTILERDVAGDLTQILDAEGGVTMIERTARVLRWVDPIGAVFEVRYDARGLTEEVIAPTGHRRQYRYDDHGNLIEILGALGAKWTATYDELGRRRSFTGSDGAITRFDYDRRGLLVKVEEPTGGVLRYSYDAGGNLATIVDAGGGMTRLVRGGSGVLTDAYLADGTHVEFRYDRMERLVRVTNGKREVHTFELNALGVVVREGTFDGRVIRYKNDELGRVVKISGDAESVELERDAAGRVIKKIYEDGMEELFTYNARGELVTASGPVGEVHFERNAVGWVTRETQSAFGRSFTVATEYDLLGQARRKLTSDGHEIEWSHDDATHTLMTRLDRAETVRSFQDVSGNEICRLLPGGGSIEAQYDFEGRVLARRVIRPDARARSSEPVWVGGTTPNATVEQRYSFTSVGDLAAVWDASVGVIDIRHDVRGQLTGVAARQTAGGPQEFAYDAAGNLFETRAGAEARTYGSGGRLQHKGSVELSWDERGCATEQRERLANGELRLTRYHVAANGRLEVVELPDGRRIESAYDPFARRVRKVVADVSAGGRRVLSTTYFFWDGMTLASEVREEAEGTQRTRAYCFDGEGMPWAHKTRITGGGAHTDEPWRFYLNDPLTGYPERLLDGAGEVISELRHSPWGRLETTSTKDTTPLRFAGQYEDEETGLFYNRHRFYDPDIGRYLTPDPLGLEGGLSPYAYAANQPQAFFDLDGLIYSQIVDPGPPEEVLHSGKNPKEGGDKQPPKWLSEKPCAEAQALTAMANEQRQKVLDEQKKLPIDKRLKDPSPELEAETKKRVQKEFKDKKLKIETFDKQDPKTRKRVDPCSKCGKMFENLGITGNVVGAKGKLGKYGVWGS
jgi:RHS repeat-associated protein